MEVKIACFSDTHNKHPYVQLPQCDIAICAGDVTSVGHKGELQSFLGWFSRQNQCTYKVFIAGNHDRCFDPKFQAELKTEKWLAEVLDSYKVNTPEGDLFYLENTGIQLLGVNIWGSPITPWFHGEYWAFNKQRGKDIAEVWEQIPPDTDILVTHGPAMYAQDYVLFDRAYVGCEDLRNKIVQVRPKLHICGHIHEGYGSEEQVETTYVNASICNHRYEPINKPIVINLDI